MLTLLLVTLLQHISPDPNTYLTKCSLPLYSPVCMASSYAEVVRSHKHLPTVDRPPPGDLVTEMTIQRVPSKKTTTTYAGTMSFTSPVFSS